MNRYRNQTPRAAFAIAAVVTSLATMLAFVGAPTLDARNDATVLARANQAAPVTVDLGRIDVIGKRDAVLAMIDAPAAAAAR